MKMNKFLYYIKNISFIGFLGALVYLFSNVNYTTISGKVFTVIILTYSIITILSIIFRDDKDTKSKLVNTVATLLHIYTIIITIGFVKCSNNFCNLKPDFLKINYLVISIVILSVIIDTLLSKQD